MEVCRLSVEPHHDLIIIVVEIQECGENPIFLLQSQWSPKTHLLPVRNAWETSARNLALDGTLDRHCHFKHVSLKQSQFCHCQTSTAHRQRIKVDGSIAIISIKNFPIGLHVMYLYFPYTPRTILFLWLILLFVIMQVRSGNACSSLQKGSYFSTTRWSLQQSIARHRCIFPGMNTDQYTYNAPYTRAVRKVLVHFEYLEERSSGLDVTWQPVRGDFTVYPLTVTLP